MLRRKTDMRGMSLLELLVVLGLIGLFVVVSTANVTATQRQLDFDQFAREVVTSLEKCRWKAFEQRCYTGVLISQRPDNAYDFSFYRDGNGNGIRTADISHGTDTTTYRTIPVQRASRDIEAAVLKTGVPEIPPKKGMLNPLDPIKFGKSNIISFSPDGQSSSGTLYLSCHSQKRMYAVVLYGPTARISLWKYSNQSWQMVGDR
jgi:prepilin-type N-terminal cleavage/methylation domain-containing protein